MQDTAIDTGTFHVPFSCENNDSSQIFTASYNSRDIIVARFVQCTGTEISITLQTGGKKLTPQQLHEAIVEKLSDLTQHITKQD